MESLAQDNSTEIAQCDREIAEAEDLLRAGHPDVEGLLRALVDWSTEKRMLTEEGR